MLRCFSCISYLSFGSEIARKTKTQATVPATVLTLTSNIALDRFICYIVFAGRGHQKIMEVVMMLIKITGKRVKFIEVSIFKRAL